MSDKYDGDRRVIACCAWSTRAGRPMLVHQKTLELLELAVTRELQIVLIGPELHGSGGSEGAIWRSTVGLFCNSRSSRELKGKLENHPVELREVVRRSQGLQKGHQFPVPEEYAPNGNRYRGLILQRRTLGLDIFDLLDPEMPLESAPSAYTLDQLDSPLARCFEVKKAERVRRLQQEDFGNLHLELVKLRARVVSNMLAGRNCRRQDYEAIRGSGIALAF